MMKVRGLVIGAAVATALYALLSGAALVHHTPEIPQTPPVRTISAARVSHLGYFERGQTIFIDITADGPATLIVNQPYSDSWIARAGVATLKTFPANLGRLGVIVPANTKSIALHRRRPVAGYGSVLLLLAALAIEVRDRRAGEIERASDDDRALV